MVAVLSGRIDTQTGNVDQWMEGMKVFEFDRHQTSTTIIIVRNDGQFVMVETGHN
jgi:hypothetical protein